MVASEREALRQARADSAFFWFWRTPKVAIGEALLQSKETILQQADSYILHTGLSSEIHAKEKQSREKKNKTWNWSSG